MENSTDSKHNKVAVSVVIINYNSSAFSIECIKSIKYHTSPDLNYEIIVVDNQSKDEDYQNLKFGIKALNYQEVQLVRNDVNAGFGGGNNFGFKHAQGKYLALVNNDVELKNDCFSVLKDAIESHTDIGVCGPTTATDRDRILPTLDFYASPLKFFFGRKIFKFVRPELYKKRKLKLDQITYGDFVSGSFMFLEADLFRKVGCFDQNIFLYHEETDLCKRLNNFNLKAACIPEAFCYHHHGASTEKSTRIKAELKRSLLYVMRKHYGYKNYKIVKSLLQLKFAFKSLFSSKYRYLLKHISQPINLETSTKVKE